MFGCRLGEIKCRLLARRWLLGRASVGASGTGLVGAGPMLGRRWIGAGLEGELGGGAGEAVGSGESFDLWRIVCS